MQGSELFRYDGMLESVFGNTESRDDSKPVVEGVSERMAIIYSDVIGCTKYATAVMTEVERISDSKKLQKVKRSNEYKDFITRYQQLARRLELYHKTKTPIEGVFQDRQIPKLVNDVIEFGKNLIKFCQDSRIDVTDVTFRPVITPQFPIVCASHKAPPEVHDWLAKTDDGFVDKRILCSMPSTYGAVAETALHLIGKYVDNYFVNAMSFMAGQATAQNASDMFSTGLKLDNQFEVCIVVQEFVGVAKRKQKEDDDTSGWTDYIKLPISIAISTLSAIRVLASMSWSALKRGIKIPAVVGGATLSLVKSLVMLSISQTAHGLTLDEYLLTMEDFTAMLRGNWVLCSFIGTGVICASTYLFSSKQILKIVHSMLQRSIKLFTFLFDSVKNLFAWAMTATTVVMDQANATASDAEQTVLNSTNVFRQTYSTIVFTMAKTMELFAAYATTYLDEASHASKDLLARMQAFADTAESSQNTTEPVKILADMETVFTKEEDVAWDSVEQLKNFYKTPVFGQVSGSMSERLYLKCMQMEDSTISELLKATSENNSEELNISICASLKMLADLNAATGFHTCAMPGLDAAAAWDNISQTMATTWGYGQTPARIHVKPEIPEINTPSFDNISQTPATRWGYGRTPAQLSKGGAVPAVEPPPPTVNTGPYIFETPNDASLGAGIFNLGGLSYFNGPTKVAPSQDYLADASLDDVIYEADVFVSRLLDMFSAPFKPETEMIKYEMLEFDAPLESKVGGPFFDDDGKPTMKGPTKVSTSQDYVHDTPMVNIVANATHLSVETVSFIAKTSAALAQSVAWFYVNQYVMQTIPGLVAPVVLKVGFEAFPLITPGMIA